MAVAMKGAASAAPRIGVPRTVLIPVDQLRELDNVRDQVGDVDDLASSIEAVGILHPLTVTPGLGMPRTPGHGRVPMVVVAGHRRLKAARQLGLTHVPVIVRDDLDDRVEPQLMENLLREDLNPIEEAQAYHRLTTGPGARSQRALAQRIGRSNAHISRHLALLQLPQEVQDQVRSGELSVTAALELRAAPESAQADAAAVQRRHPAQLLANRLRSLLEPQLAALSPQLRYSLEDVLVALEQLASRPDEAEPGGRPLVDVMDAGETEAQRLERERRRRIDDARRALEEDRG